MRQRTKNQVFNRAKQKRNIGEKEKGRIEWNNIIEIVSMRKILPDKSESAKQKARRQDKLVLAPPFSNESSQLIGSFGQQKPPIRFVSFTETKSTFGTDTFVSFRMEKNFS